MLDKIKRIFQSYILILYLSLLNSCQTLVEQKIDPNKVYRKDLILESTGRASMGTLVLRDQNSYKITITSPYSMNILKITSCHRSILLQDKKITKKAKTYIGRLFKIEDNKMLNSKTFYYTQILGIEKTRYGSCPLMIESYSTEEGRFSTGIIAFENDNFKLHGTLECGGKVTGREGVSICQEKENLRQGISFLKPVEYKVTPNTCPKMYTKDNMNFYYQIGKGICSYVFLTQSGKDELHELISFGFQERILK